MPKARPTPQTTQEPVRQAGDLRLRFDRGVRRAAVTVDAARGLALWDEATRMFEFVLATEAPCRECRWDVRTWMCLAVDEDLDMSGLVDLEGIKLRIKCTARANDKLAVLVAPEFKVCEGLKGHGEA